MAKFATLSKKQNGKEVIINADDVSSMDALQTKGGGTQISMKNGDKHKVNEQLEDVKKALGAPHFANQQ